MQYVPRFRQIGPRATNTDIAITAERTAIKGNIVPIAAPVIVTRHTVVISLEDTIANNDVLRHFTVVVRFDIEPTAGLVPINSAALRSDMRSSFILLRK